MSRCREQCEPCQRCWFLSDVVARGGDSSGAAAEGEGVAMAGTRRAALAQCGQPAELQLRDHGAWNPHPALETVVQRLGRFALRGSHGRARIVMPAEGFLATALRLACAPTGLCAASLKWADACSGGLVRCHSPFTAGSVPLGLFVIVGSGFGRLSAGYGALPRPGRTVPNGRRSFVIGDEAAAGPVSGALAPAAGAQEADQGLAPLAGPELLRGVHHVLLVRYALRRRAHP